MSRRDFNHDKPSRSNRRPKPGPPRDRSRSPQSASPVPQTGPKHSGQQRHPRDSARHSEGESGPGKLERVQKVLAHAGLGSRRSCEELIKQGRVTVDGKVVRELGTRVDADRARIAVDGEAIRRESMVYYAVNKPKGYVSTTIDPAGRPRVLDLLPEIPQRVYTVGRLDEESTGLMILTNDGELANRLAHPRYGVEKLYRALIAGSPDPEVLAKLTAGVWLSDGKVRAKRARIVGRQGQANVLELVLAEGKNREIRRMLAKLGHKVMSLNRVAVGPVSIKGLSSGECRSLSRHEVDLLWKVANGAAVSLPRFLDGDSSPRSRRDSSRPREAGRRPTRQDRAGPPLNRQRDSSQELTPARSPKQSRQAVPPRSSQSQPARSPRTNAAPRHTPPPQGPPTRKPPDHRQADFPTTKRPPRAKRAAANAHSPAPAPAKRRIIGLDLQPPTVSGSQSDREHGRKKRPAPRQLRSSPTPRMKRPTVPFRPPGTDGENA
jgi:23S rRNA pseudouridine2605 synthase